MCNSVSRVPSAAGISTEISRLISFWFGASWLVPVFAGSVVSVGLTFCLSPAAASGGFVERRNRISYGVHLSVKTEGEDRQTRGGSSRSVPRIITVKVAIPAARLRGE